MAKPILLSVDDDSGVLRAIERDLRSQYGAEYRVIGSDSPEGALEVLKQLKVRNDNVALLLADQRMPRMDGVEFLQEGMRIFPDAKRALLTAYADTTAAINAINQANINYFFLKPWDPPTEHLYPQLDDLLDDWQASYRPALECRKKVMVEREAPGGQAGMSSRIENYLVFPIGLSGGDLARRAVVQAQRFGVEILSPQEAVGVRTEGSYRIIKLADGNEISCHALMVATGVQWRRLEAPGVDRLQGAGIYYGGGATEALSCKGEIVYVVGGANSAGQAAMNFAKYAERVVILVRGTSLSSTMSQYLIDQIQEVPNIQLWTHASVAEAHGGTHLEEISVLCSDTNKVERVPASAMFIFIGALPRTDWLANIVERDVRGFILTGPDLIRDGQRPKGWALDRDPFLLETNVPGIFAVGDVRHGSIKRVASGVGEGSVAVQFIHQYLSKV